MGERSATSEPHIMCCPTRTERSEVRAQRGLSSSRTALTKSLSFRRNY